MEKNYSNLIVCLKMLNIVSDTQKKLIYIFCVYIYMLKNGGYSVSISQALITSLKSRSMSHFNYLLHEI